MGMTLHEMARILRDAGIEEATEKVLATFSKKDLKEIEEAISEHKFDTVPASRAPEPAHETYRRAGRKERINTETKQHPGQRRRR